jgi:hypothetical protein
MRDLSTRTLEIIARQSSGKAPIPDGPRAIVSPETVAHPEDVRAIVAYVAHQILLNELDYHGADLGQYHPALIGLSDRQIRDAIAEAVA